MPINDFEPKKIQNRKLLKSRFLRLSISYGPRAVIDFQLLKNFVYISLISTFFFLFSIVKEKQLASYTFDNIITLWSVKVITRLLKRLKININVSLFVRLGNYFYFLNHGNFNLPWNPQILADQLSKLCPSH